MTYEGIVYGMDGEISELIAYGLHLQDMITHDVRLSPSEVYDRLTGAVEELNSLAAGVHMGRGVELSGLVWAPYIKNGDVDIDMEVSVPARVHGIANGFTLRREHEDMQWLAGEGAEPQQRLEIGHSIFTGQRHHKTWLGEAYTNTAVFGALGMTTLRCITDINRMKQAEYAEVIDFERKESNILGEILHEAPTEERLRLLGDYFMTLAIRWGAYHPMVKSYLSYVNHGLDLVKQKTQIATADAIAWERDRYVPYDQEEIVGTVDGLCFVATKALNETINYPYQTKQALFMSLTTDLTTKDQRNLLIPAQSIVECVPIHLVV